LPHGELTIGDDVHSVVLCDLEAGVEYHIKVAAATSKGYGAAATMSTWTEIGTPEKPSKPRVNSTGPGTITVLIQPAVLTQGPISAYFIVINTPTGNYSGTVGRRRRAADSRGGSLPDPVLYIPLPGLTVAQLAADDVKLARYFVVGDGQTYGGYENSPLPGNIMYAIHYVVASSLDGETKMSFASTDSPVAPRTGQLTLTTMEVPQASGERLSRDAIIALAVMFSLVLLVLLIAASVAIYRYCKDRRRQPPHSPRTAGSPLNTSWLKYYTGRRCSAYPAKNK